MRFEPLEAPTVSLLNYMDANTTAISTKPLEGQPYDVVIIGSGPAGLTAAIYTTRGALSTLILGGTKWGGQLMLTSEVDNYPGFPEGVMGPDLMVAMRKQAERFGAVFLEKDVERVDFSKASPFSVWADGQEYRGRSVIIATGAETRWLGIPSEQKLIGRGVSSCAPCDAPFFRDKNVFVLGGGDSAMEEALVLTKYASGVTVVHRRDAFRASQVMQQKVLNHPKIKVIWNSEVEEILGTDRVTGIRLKNVQTQEVTEFEAQGVFVAIGHLPSSKTFEGQVDLDEKGYVKKSQNGHAMTAKVKSQNDKGEEIGSVFSMMTSVQGVFVAGDVHDHHYRQAITAAGMGCMAAMDVERWLQNRG